MILVFFKVFPILPLGSAGDEGDGEEVGNV
jgi:hypothetical protein